jgi:diacylglycerol kinase (ATP)
MGGDDTIQAVIRGMAGSKARLGMIAVGTANNLAKSLGIPEDVDKACDIIAEGNVRKLDLGQVKVKKGKKLHFFELVILGIGAAIYPHAIKVRKGKRVVQSLKGVVQTVLSHETAPKGTLQMDEESNVTVESMLAIVSNAPLIGPNMLLDPDASMDDGLLDVSVYPNFSKGQLLALSAKSLNGKEPDDGKIQRYRVEKVTIKTKPKLDVMADGIMLGKGKVKIKVFPGALRIYAPEVGAGVEKPKEETGADLPTPVAPAPGSEDT